MEALARPSFTIRFLSGPLHQRCPILGLFCRYRADPRYWPTITEGWGEEKETKGTNTRFHSQPTKTLDPSRAIIFSKITWPPPIIFKPPLSIFLLHFLLLEITDFGRDIQLSIMKRYYDFDYDSCRLLTSNRHSLHDHRNFILIDVEIINITKL